MTKWKSSVFKNSRGFSYKYDTDEPISLKYHLYVGNVMHRSFKREFGSLKFLTHDSQNLYILLYTLR